MRTLKNKPVRINLETLVLVAVWENPSVFQGCIKITELENNKEFFYFFRCHSAHKTQNDTLHTDFSSDDYNFTHLYNEFGLIQLTNLDSVKEYALDMMKYALHVTLRQMITNRKVHFTSIDDIAMQAMINNIIPILSQEVPLSEAEHIGFAVAMDFSPQEEMGHLAVQALLNQLVGKSLN